MKWDALNGFWPTDEDIECRRRLREKTFCETLGRIDLFATCVSVDLRTGIAVTWPNQIEQSEQ